MPQFANGRVYYRASELSLADGSPAAVFSSAEISSDHLSFAWHPNGEDLTVGQTPGASGPSMLSLSMALRNESSAIAGQVSGLELPVAWSKDGNYLAARSFEGRGLADLGRESGAIVTMNGERKQIPAEGEVDFIGWLSPGR
jgi:hypothetical protein